ncbi:MAG: hypothetical protein CTY12_00960 [Methylotenera sp.]|nr:MAG: hypothetical protein CTY12_00960 [Methylotenera sp.]
MKRDETLNTTANEGDPIKMQVNTIINRHCLALDLDMVTWVELTPRQKRQLKLRIRRLLNALGGLAAAW